MLFMLWLVWSSFCTSNLSKNPAHLLTGTNRFEHISPVLSSFHWLPVDHRIYFRTLMLIYKSLNDLVPLCLSHYTLIFLLSPEIIWPTTLVFLTTTKAQTRSGYFSRGTKLWNLLPSNVIQASLQYFLFIYLINIETGWVDFSIFSVQCSLLIYFKYMLLFFVLHLPFDYNLLILNVWYIFK